MHKIIALILTLCFLTTLPGCSSGKIGQYDAPEETAPAEQTDPPAETDPPVETDDPETPEETAGGEEDAAAAPTATPVPLVGDAEAIYAKFAPDTVVATVNGQNVTWENYHYWLNYFVWYVQYVALSNGITLSDWNANELDADSTNGQLVLLNAEDMLRQYFAVEAMAKERNIALTEDDRAQVLSAFEQAADSTSGDGDGSCTEEEATAFEDYLSQQFLSRESFDHMNEMDCLFEDMFVDEYGENGEKLSDEDALAYADRLGVRAAKHILLLTIDQTTSEALSDEEIAEKKAKADEIQAQLAAAADDPETLETLFDELAEQYNEDPGSSAYPDGYAYVPGVMVTEFEDAVSALPVGGISQVVETSYGYHVIMRVPVGTDCTVMDTSGQTMNLRTAAANAAFSQELLDAMDALDIQWTEDFDSVDIGELFGPDI